MFEKMIGVSPPQKGEALETKSADSRSIREALKGDFKKDFEKTLQSKLDQRLSDRRIEKKKADLEQSKEAERKLALNRKEERRADEDADKKSESLGGKKKKVTENEDKMVSGVMASQESEVETPVLKTIEPAQIEVEISKVESDQLTGLNESLPAATVLPDAEESAAEMQLIKQEQPEISFENELRAAVGMEARSESSMNPEIALTSDAEKLQSSEKALKFEQSVLDRLQKDLSAQMPQSMQEENSAQGDSSAESGRQSDLLSSDQTAVNELHQAAGQSHTDFKAQLSQTVSANSSDKMPQLEDNREANIRDLMNQAQYLVKKGGGEVTVKMTPEGMGEVQLKVMLENGKLNIQMQTQDRDVKKLIEDSLSELKSGLAAHRLSLEHVKIDTVNATNTDNSAQMQSNLSQGQADGRAREFWSDLQGQMNQNSRQRSGSSDYAGAAGPIRSVASASSQSLRTYGGTKGATVNRVA